MINEIKKAILSGILISLGGCIYLATAKAGIGFIGAFLFTIGLYTICEYGLNLYTGKVGYLVRQYRDGKYWGLLGITLLFNLITAFLVGMLVSIALPDIAQQAETLYAAKLSYEPIQWFVSSVFCGILMFIAVDIQKCGSKLAMFLCVPAFILAGFDHSIANMFYNGAALGNETFTLRNAAFVVIAILGNAVGGMLIPLFSTKSEKQ